MASPLDSRYAIYWIETHNRQVLVGDLAYEQVVHEIATVPRQDLRQIDQEKLLGQGRANQRHPYSEGRGRTRPNRQVPGRG